MTISRRDTILAAGVAGAALLATEAAAAVKPTKLSDLAPGQQKLVQTALAVRQKAYAPYSHFLVGAALMAADGTVFKGCNVENISYGATICAERNALFHAVASGHRKFKAIAVVGDLPAPITPCGMCRQVLGEFGGDTQVICANLKGDVMVTTVGALLPAAFNFDPSKT
ncbi:MAG: cytidine deaminase [Proteobacteria bacterium]|nr:cytidine deaminase [Pseudomonadota bacterium]